MTQIEQFDTFKLRPDERLSFWNSLCESTLSGTRVDSQALGFRAKMLRWNVGPLTLLRPRSDASKVQRKQSDETASKRLILHFMNRGTSGFTRAGRDITIRTGEFILNSPYLGYDFSLSQDHELLVVEMPLTPVAERIPTIDAKLHCHLGSAATTKILQEFLLSMWRHGEYADHFPGWAEEVSDTFYDLLSMALRYHTSVEDKATDKPQAAMLRRAQVFIENHLSDPQLTTASIADDLNISVRSVQHLFALSATTPSTYILERRLLLASDKLKTEPEASITHIAYETGFRDSAYFSRCFRRRYGVAPKTWRS